jgi:predicted HicB family RNase H-like nuclease
MVPDNVNDIAHHHGTPGRDGDGQLRDGDGQLRLSVSPTVHARLAREAAERGMRLEDWAVLKLGLTRIAGPSLAHARLVSPWRTRC